MSLRKIIKNRGSFPTDDAALKLLYLALQNIVRKWTMPIKEWKAALNRFAISSRTECLPSNDDHLHKVLDTLRLLFKNCLWHSTVAWFPCLGSG